MLGTKTTRDIYIQYAKNLLKEHPEYWGKYSQRIPNFRIYRLGLGNMPIEVISYTRYKKVIDSWFKNATTYIILGYALQLGHKIGKIAGRLVERNHTNKQVTWKASEEKWRKQGLQKGDKRTNPVYFIDDEWLRIGWEKTGKLRYDYLYKFDPAEGNKSGRGFKKEFSAANKADSTLRRRYRFYPFKQIEKND